LRDLYVRGKYRDVILPMTVLRRLDAIWEGSKKGVIGTKVSLDKAGVVDPGPGPAFGCLPGLLQQNIKGSVSFFFRGGPVPVLKGLEAGHQDLKKVKRRNRDCDSFSPTTPSAPSPLDRCGAH
jgi:hypothetical protein